MSRVAFVTGGTRGIGRAISARLRAGGYKVAAGYAGNEVAAQSCSDELGVFCVKGNVSSFSDCAEAVKKVEAELGPIDTLINNAGITRDAVLHRMTEEQWSEVIRVNLASIFNMTRNVIEGMRERNFGRIVNISSINGQKGQIGQSNYSAAKAGMIGFTKALAQEIASRGITANCVAPGFIESPMTDALNEAQKTAILGNVPLGRLGVGADVASACVYLASDESAYVTGQTLHVNGGMAMI